MNFSIKQSYYKVICCVHKRYEKIHFLHPVSLLVLSLCAVGLPRFNIFVSCIRDEKVFVFFYSVNFSMHTPVHACVDLTMYMRLYSVA